MKAARHRRILLDAAVILLDLFLHDVSPAGVEERRYFGYGLVLRHFFFHGLVVHDDPGMEIFCSISSPKLSLTAPTNTLCESVEIFDAGIRLSSWVFIDVEVSLR